MLFIRVIALESIPPYTTLTRDMLAVDEQTMHQRVASRLVHESEIEHYLGGMVIETIHAGEPLRRNAVVTADNPAAVRRLSLALTDPDMIAAVIPVSASGSNAAIIPDNVSAGDYVNVTMGLAGSVSSMASSAGSASQWGAPPSLTTPTPTPALTSTLPPTATLPVSPSPLPLNGKVPEPALSVVEAVAPPLDKIVLPHVDAPQVRVIDVARERVPNPNYGMTFGQEGAQEPPFLEGNLESITLLVPKAAEELLYFAVDNGTLHISVVPHAAVLEGASPSTGVLWEDADGYIRRALLPGGAVARAGRGHRHYHIHHITYLPDDGDHRNTGTAGTGDACPGSRSRGRGAAHAHGWNQRPVEWRDRQPG